MSRVHKPANREHATLHSAVQLGNNETLRHPYFLVTPVTHVHQESSESQRDVKSPVKLNNV